MLSCSTIDSFSFLCNVLGFDNVSHYSLLWPQSALDIQKHESNNNFKGTLFIMCEVQFTCNASAIAIAVDINSAIPLRLLSDDG